MRGIYWNKVEADETIGFTDDYEKFDLNIQDERSAYDITPRQLINSAVDMIEGVVFSQLRNAKLIKAGDIGAPLYLDVHEYSSRFRVISPMPIHVNGEAATAAIIETVLFKDNSRKGVELHIYKSDNYDEIVMAMRDVHTAVSVMDGASDDENATIYTIAVTDSGNVVTVFGDEYKCVYTDGTGIDEAYKKLTEKFEQIAFSADAYKKAVKAEKERVAG